MVWQPNHPTAKRYGLAVRPKPAPIHAGARGHVLWPGRQSTQSAQFPGGKRDAPCGAPDAAEPVERKPLPPHTAGVRTPSLSADISGGRTSGVGRPIFSR